MKQLQQVVLIIIVVSTFCCLPLKSYKIGDQVDYSGWTVQWEDQFDGPSINTSNFHIVDTNIVYNNELEAYCSNNSYISNGKLVLESKVQSYLGKDYTSGKVTTNGLVNVTYGRVEAYIQLPWSKGMWPAFWMMPVETSQQVEDCYLIEAEIDILENVGEEDLIYGSFHHSTGNATTCWDQLHSFSSKGQSIPTLNSTFHLYSVIWTPDQMAYLIDNKVYAVVDNAPPNFTIPSGPFYIILNTAVGGNWPGTPNQNTVWPQYHYIDYVRVLVNSNNSDSSSRDEPSLGTKISPFSSLSKLLLLTLFMIITYLL